MNYVLYWYISFKGILTLLINICSDKKCYSTIQCLSNFVFYFGLLTPYFCPRIMLPYFLFHEWSILDLLLISHSLLIYFVCNTCSICFSPLKIVQFPLPTSSDTMRQSTWHLFRFATSIHWLIQEQICATSLYWKFYFGQASYSNLPDTTFKVLFILRLVSCENMRKRKALCKFKTFHRSIQKLNRSCLIILFYYLSNCSTSNIYLARFLDTLMIHSIFWTIFYAGSSEEASSYTDAIPMAQHYAI